MISAVESNRQPQVLHFGLGFGPTQPEKRLRRSPRKLQIQMVASPRNHLIP
jgi:hypothetical protein